MKIGFFVVAVVFFVCQAAESSTINAASCSSTDVNSAIAYAATGDIVNIPAGNCTWNSTVIVNKAITLFGVGKKQTIVTKGITKCLAITSSNANVKNIGFVTDTNSSGNDFISVSGVNQWTISGCSFDQTVKAITGYVINLTSQPSNTTNTIGVIFDNDIMMSGEQVLNRGPCDSWDTSNSIGGEENLFVEGNTFTMRPGGSTGYWDCNANARTVFRYNTFNGVYIDAHGSWSNYSQCSPEYHPSARHTEIYNNAWDGNVGWTSIYIRGGTGVIFNNTVSNTNYGWIMLDEYYVRSGKLSDSSWPYFPSACACDADYPVIYQIGRGLNNKTNPAYGSNQESEPMFIWNNTKDGSSLTLTANPYGGPSSACKTYCNNQSESVADFVASGRDYYTRAPQAGDYLADYTSYPCPHPLAGSGKCDGNISGRNGYTITQSNLSSPGNIRILHNQ